MARLVIGGETAGVVGDHPALLLRPGDDLQHGFMQVGGGDELAVLPGGQQGGLVEQVGQVRPGKARGGLGNLGEGHVLGQGLGFGVDLQDGLTAPDVGQTHIDLPVKAARAQQGGVQDVLAVGGGQDDDPLVRAEAVHLHQQLVQGLLPFVVSAPQAGAPAAAHGVDLVDEDDGGGFLLGLLEQVPDAGRAHAHIQLHKVRAGDGQEVDPGLPGHRLGDEGLARAGRAHQQHALGDAGPQGGKALRVPEELHDLLKLPLLLLGPGHVIEGDGLALVGQGAGAGVAEAVGPGRASAGSGPLAEDDKQEHTGGGHHEHGADEGVPPGVFDARGIVIAL